MNKPILSALEQALAFYGQQFAICAREAARTSGREHANVLAVRRFLLEEQAQCVENLYRGLSHA